RELSWQSRHNPRPQSKAPGSRGGSRSERLVEEHLSPARLALAQVDDLRLVSVLELCVNTHENSLGNFGLHLPNLSQLKLNGSCLGSLRDLGTSLGRLQVLWLARCGLADLDGIGSFPALKELYLSYNDVSDLSPLCLLEQLEVLDLESNCLDHDWLMVKEAIKEGSVLHSLLPGLGTDGSRAGRVLCGNPTKGLQEHRHQCQVQPAAPRRPCPGLTRLPRHPPKAPSRTLGYNLTPSPPKSLMPSDRGSSSWGSTDLQFRGRRLRALGSLGPGLGQGLAAVTALRALEVASGPSPRAEG
ncbi:hypothetical protein E2I00_019896, partial [Balaenoptera physalus]